MVRKRSFPMRAEGRGSSAEAFLRGRACKSSSFQEPWLSTCKLSQLCVIPNISPRVKSPGLTTSLKPSTRKFSAACLLGTIQASYPKTSPGTRRSRKLRGRSAEDQHATLDPSPYLCFQNPFFTPWESPNELLLMQPHVAAKSQLHSYGNDSLSLWPRVASKCQLDLHENLCVNVAAFLKTCHPSAEILCVYTPNLI